MGAKNIASSSGCAMSKQMRLFSSLGNRERVTVTVYSQAVTARMGSAKTVTHCMLKIWLAPTSGGMLKGGENGASRRRAGMRRSHFAHSYGEIMAMGGGGGNTLERHAGMCLRALCEVDAQGSSGRPPGRDASALHCRMPTLIEHRHRRPHRRRSTWWVVESSRAVDKSSLAG